MKNVPRSSQIHRFTNKCAFGREEMYNVMFVRKSRKMSGSKVRNKCKWLVAPRKRHRKSRKPKAKVKCKYCAPIPNNTIKSKDSNKCNSPTTSVYKDLNHRVIYCKFNLSRDIENNPGPSPVIDPSKTIHAPYSQGNITLFGLNARRQCVAMSLCALIYNHRNSITSPIDLVNIMNIGNELYSGLSRLSRQSYLMLTELPDMTIVFNTNYQLQYSQSYTGRIHGDCTLEDVPYCMPLHSAL
jgi:hypothetical protein